MGIVASIHGRAARDGELRQSQTGKPWCRVSVACEAGADRETNEPLTQWITVVAFGRQAEALAKVGKGQTLSAIGRVELNKWVAQDGTSREALQLIAEAVLTPRSARPSGRRPSSNGDSTNRPAAEADVPFNDPVPF